MGQYAISNEAEVRVAAAAGFSVSVAPTLVTVDAGSVDMVARFVVTVTRDVGYTKPVYLNVAGTSMGVFMLGDVSITDADNFGLLPADQGMCYLDFDLGGQPADFGFKFQIQGFEDKPI